MKGFARSASVLLLVLSAGWGASASAAASPAMSSALQAAAVPPPGRADLATLALQSDTVLRARIERAKEVKRERAPGLAPGFHRLLIRADTQNVVVAPERVPAEIEYLVDVPATSRGRAPKLEGQSVLLFLGREHAPGEYVLAHKYGQQPWTAEAEALAARYLRERAEAPNSFTRAEAVTSAFHVPGTLPGESESQIFIRTETGTPLSLIVLNRPGQAPRVSLATGDIIDPDAPAPDPASLSAVTLVCSLPPELPADVASGADSAALKRDYQAGLEALGRCDRNF